MDWSDALEVKIREPAFAKSCGAASEDEVDAGQQWELCRRNSTKFPTKFPTKFCRRPMITPTLYAGSRANQPRAAVCSLCPVPG